MIPEECQGNEGEDGFLFISRGTSEGLSKKDLRLDIEEEFYALSCFTYTNYGI